MALLWRNEPYSPGDGTAGTRHCDAVESATQKENGGVLGRSPKNKKSNLTATHCEPITQKPGSSYHRGVKGKGGLATMVG